MAEGSCPNDTEPDASTVAAMIQKSGFVYLAGVVIALDSGTASSPAASAALRSQAVQVIQYGLPILRAKFSRVHRLLDIRLRLLQSHQLLQLTFSTGLDALQSIQTIL